MSLKEIIEAVSSFSFQADCLQSASLLLDLKLFISGSLAALFIEILIQI